MSYTAAPACQLLATHCCCCGTPLLNSTSIELGMGPDCRKKNGITSTINSDTQNECNRLTRLAAIAAQNCNVEEVNRLADQIATLGLTTLANKIRKRFVNAERKAKIRIVDRGDALLVETPFRRSASSDFIDAWRNIPGRRYDRSRNANVVPVNEKRRLWELLKRFFPGEFGTGPQGLFRIPEAA